MIPVFLRPIPGAVGNVSPYSTSDEAFAGIGVVGSGADLCSLAREGHLGFAASPDLLAQANLHLSLTAKEAVGYTRGRASRTSRPRTRGIAPAI